MSSKPEPTMLFLTKTRPTLIQLARLTRLAALGGGTVGETWATMSFDQKSSYLARAALHAAATQRPGPSLDSLAVDVVIAQSTVCGSKIKSLK